MEQKLSLRLDYLGELLTCGQSLYLWEFDPELNLLRSSCPDLEPFQGFFPLSGCQDYLAAYLRRRELAPLVLSDTLGMSWIADFELLGGQLCRVYLIGPAFTSDIPVERISLRLRQHNLPLELTREFQERVFALPIIPHANWLQFGMMLHYTVTGEKIGLSDFRYQDSAEASEDEPVREDAPGSGTYLAEERAMRMIEQGCLDYGSAFDRLAASGHFSLANETVSATRDMKNAVIAFVTLATRAAIRGGVDVETAYLVGGVYFRQAEQAATFTELMRVNAAAYDDFIHRVHRVKSESSLSPAVRQCQDYIELHVAEKLSLKDLAAHTGYAANYLAQKFKKETGKTVSHYILEKKIEQAGRMLRGTSREAQEISEALGFCNPSYFAEKFRQVTGITPGEYRRFEEKTETRKKRT